MKNDLDDTIAAVATPVGEGGIGIVRLSGKGAWEVASKIFKARRKNFSLQNVEAGRLYYGNVIDGQGSIVDEALVSFFKLPYSYTAEDMVEVNAHGGRITLRGILDLALKNGARMAEPGEFTKRAFLNGRLDLTQAEAVLDTIRAKTDSALKVAMSQLQGSLSKEVRLIKDDLMKVYAHMEAYLDFPEDDVEVFSSQDFRARYESIEKRIGSLLGSFGRGEILREGILTVIVGKPNVGKSSLLNALLERDRAIVSEIPGTTRDAIEEEIEIDGVRIRLADTAGLFLSEEPLTKAGIERTKRYLSEGDLFLFVLDAASEITADDLKVFSELSGRRMIPVVNKIDLVPEKKLQSTFGDSSKIGFPVRPCFISATAGANLPELERRIGSLVSEGKVERESAMITRLRHKRALEESLEALKKSHEAFLAKESLEFVVVDLKRSLDCLREMVGEVYTEDLLEAIFSEFCIGK